ncbi:MAG: domain S-box [Anaerosolibacter sp.]|jgi:sigma-B regulation protein RsbU (phosphoserine phosphatase)|uniref:PP2C family protein-serine/threonine phosphatase n=1 Tax=Anaerosolibacter sp. TaxID=1872527 RepID=UPI002615C72A|nr:SpoIIE family protein phosphatase [Anaerosolibacter sp.]MDF2548541.1 domain S-box [Anaerosolibacter sp.]
MEESIDVVKINKTIADMVDDHIMVCNLEGQIVFSNKAMQSYLGYDDLELKQKSFLDIIDDIHSNRAKSFIKSVSEKPSGWEEFLFNGKHDVLKLHLKLFQENNLIYIYGNEKYVEYERIRKKLDVEIANAIKIHKRSLPESLPDTENISFASLYIPAEELGGDLFDVFRVDNGLLNDYFEQYVCFIADVSGHGLDSAMLSIFVKDTIRSFFRLKHIPGQLLSPKEIMDFFVEQYIKEGYPDEYLVCLFLVVFDLKTNELTYCNAGFHKCPLLVRDRENIIELDNGGMPISAAIDPDWLKYEDYSLYLSSAMTLFIMSDGLPEQRSNNEFYEERLKKLATEIYCLKPVDIVRKIHEDVTNFLRHDKINDDITLVVVKLS